MHDPTIERLIGARVSLILQTPFFGNMATRMKLIEQDEEVCPTAATNGRDFFYSKKFIESLNDEELEFLFGHEVLHAVLDHIGRLGSRDHRVANWAKDYAVNQILEDEGIGKRPSHALYDSKYRGMPWEEIYDILMSRAKKISMKALIKEMGGEGGFDVHMDVKGIGEDDGDGEGDSDGDGEGGGKSNCNSNGKGGGNSGDESKGDGKGKKSGKMPKLTEEELEEIRNEVKQALLQSAAAAGAGNVPAAIMRLIKDLTEPKMNWKQFVQQEIQSLIKNDFTFTRPARKGWQSGCILPGMKDDIAIDVAIAIDMSGSISNDDAAAFLAEIRGIMEQYNSFKINLFTFDTQVYNPVEITQDNPYDFEEYEPQGGGGTNFIACWEHMLDNDINPKKFIMFTDGMPCNSGSSHPGLAGMDLNDGFGPEIFDTLFIIKGNPGCVPPFGAYVEYESLD